MPTDALTTKEFCDRGEDYYRTNLMALVESEYRGKFLALDADSGDYQIEEQELRAIEKLLARHPGTKAYVLRIGYPAAHSFCGWSSREEA
jgi:hypothetical protein